ncbi:uncharacterized protein LOC141679831 [Apium graveolens]|uniref:uncharacterized protein LOC141679831 n=1 Tax=Apium graveolens TaxID=4045 RepID=UPI003D7B29C5
MQQQAHGSVVQSSNEKYKLEELRLMCKSQAVSIKTLENQIGQIANALLNRPQGTLLSDTEANLGKREVKEQLKAITLRSGKVANHQKLVAEKKEELHRQKNTNNKQVYLPPPYPKRLQKQKINKQFAKFLAVFKKLHINIPFTKALEQRPSYAKFMKGILSQKLKLEELETVALTEECSALLQHKLPRKLKDPGSFTIPCTIGKLSFDKSLCDLGASINLMPLSVFMQLGLPDQKPRNISLQLADRSITYPGGIVEDVLVKVDKLIFPSDFVILDFEEDKKIPTILGTPFLATGRILIDECYKVELVDSVVKSEMEQLLRSDTLERALTRESEIEDEEGVEQLQLLNASKWKRKLDIPFESLGIAELKNSQEHLKLSIKEAPILELKPLADHLRYAFLGDPSTLPIFIASSLSGSDEDKILRILRELKSTIRWNIADIKKISPSYCIQKKSAGGRK